MRARGRIRRRRSWSAPSGDLPGAGSGYRGMPRHRRAELGHAERVAADPANDLRAAAPLRRPQSAPAALVQREQGRCPDALRCRRSAGPGRGHGGDERCWPRRTGQGVEPVPKLGFSGAAAVDAQGRFAGTVDLTSPVAAGGAFRAAAGDDRSRRYRSQLPHGARHHPETGAAPAADHAAIEKSVMRVICVRK